jgi:hypothetical protein
MIDDSRLDASFGQPSDGCVLAAYAIANNYFTARPPAAAFDAYCEHFGRSERWPASGPTFCHDANQRHGPAWSERVLDLHRTSTIPFFRDSRAAFSGELVQNGSAPAMIPRLQATESILVVGHLPASGGRTHVISVGATPFGFVVKDTNKSALFHARLFNEILGNYGWGYRFTDGAIYSAGV